MARRNLRNFDPSVFATLDADMWIVYYNHQFLRLFILLLKLNYTYFKPNPILTLQGAYNSAMAAMVFRKTKGAEDNERVLKYLTQFYSLLSGHTVDAFNYREAAEFEMKWWFVDRYPSRYKISRASALADSMAAIYNVPTSRLATYGQKRAEAMELLGQYHHDTAAKVNWGKLRQLLQESYEGLYEAVNQNAPK
jgi:hypothetical protein